MRLLWGIAHLAVGLAMQPVPTKTIIDVLSSNPQFSELMGLLQDHELVPLINGLWNCTLLAPVNSAFTDIDKATISRDQLLYHLINATAYSSEFASGAQIYQTFLDGGAAPISLSLAYGVNNKVEFDDLDLLASPQRGLVHSLAEMLDIPSTISKQMYMENDVADFASLLDGDVPLKGTTVLAPASDSIKEWLADSVDDKNSADILFKYLRSPYGKEDRKRLVRRHISRGIVNPAHSPQELIMLDGTRVTLLENYTLVGPDFQADAAPYVVVARNGVHLELHNQLLASDAEQFLDLTPEKFIIGMGGHALVRTLSLYGHRDLIDGSSSDNEERTIIVPLTTESPQPKLIGKGSSTDHDEIEKEYMVSEDYTSENGVLEPRMVSDPGTMVLYQFLDGSLPEKGDSFLLNTKMPLRSDKAFQRVHFERRKSGALTLNWEVLDSKSYHWRNDTFYTTQELLATPPSLAMALGPLLSSSFSLSFLDKLNRLQLPFSKSWTLFVPTRDAWEKDLLLKDYLDTNSEALSKVFDNLILSEPVYSDSKKATVKQYSGIPTDVSWDPDLKQFLLENAELRAYIQAENTDALFDNGVAHIVNSVPLPSTLEISTSDLISSGGRSYFLDLLKAADMAQVLDPSANFTILVPPPSDLKKNNYTTDTDIKKLQAMLKLHLIPDSLIQDLTDGAQAMTLAGEPLEVQSLGPFGKFWGLSPQSATAGQRVVLYESGKTNGVINSGSSVMFVDRHISPAWIVPVHFGLKKGTYALFGLLLGIVLASALVFGLVWLVSTQNKAEPVPDDEQGVYHDADSDDDSPSGNEADGESRSQPTGPIETPGVAENRAYGRHLNLPG